MCIILISSCGNEESPITNSVVKGKPTAFIYEGTKLQDLYHYVNDNQLSEISYDNGNTSMKIHYSDNELTKCTFTRNPIYGGISKMEFQKINDNEISALFFFDDDSYAAINQTISLNNEGLPIKISIKNDENEEMSVREFSYYSNTTKIHKAIYHFSSENNLKTIRTYIYEYDNHPGSTSKVNCPIWFRVLLNNLISDQPMISLRDKELLNYTNNIVKIEVLSNEELLKTDEYQYTYDEEKYPVSVIDPIHRQTISIKY